MSTLTKIAGLMVVIGALAAVSSLISVVFIAAYYAFVEQQPRVPIYSIAGMVISCITVLVGCVVGLTIEAFR